METLNYLAECEKGEKERQAKENAMRNCCHAFVKLQEERPYNNNGSMITLPRVIACVHCGLTNQYMFLDNMGSLGKPSMETVVFRETIQNLNEVPLISDEVLQAPSFNAQFLYAIAKEINPDGTDEELFQVMQAINELGSEREKFALPSSLDKEELKRRYQTQRGMRKIKTEKY